MMIRNVNKLFFYENGHIWCISWWSILLSIMIVKIKCHLLTYCSLNKFLLNVYAYLCCKLDIHVTDLYSCIKISIIFGLIHQTSTTVSVQKSNALFHKYPTECFSDDEYLADPAEQATWRPGDCWTQFADNQTHSCGTLTNWGHLASVHNSVLRCKVEDLKKRKTLLMKGQN